jgi:hypothetical protein
MRFAEVRGFPRCLLPRSTTWRIVLVAALAAIYLGRIALHKETEARWSAAVQTGNSVSVQFLVSHVDLDIEARLWNGLTPLQHAVRSRDREMVRTLINLGADPHRTLDPKMPTAFETAREDEELMGELFRTDRQALNECDENHYTLLMYAAASNDARLTRMLIAAGADIDATCGTAKNALTMAIATHSNEALRILASAKPDYLKPLGNRMQAVDVARLAKNAAALEMLEAPTAAAMKTLNTVRRQQGYRDRGAVDRATYESIVRAALPPLNRSGT